MAQVRRFVVGVAMTGVALVLVAAATALAGERASEQDIPLDKEPESNSTLISLGPIGARVKTDHRVETCADSQSSQGTVKYIFKNSLAEVKLQLEDVIVGINGQDFNKDFSRKMAAEIDRAEGGSGRLVLKIQRGGKPLEVAFDVPKIGSYSNTFPYDCRKSELILEAACDWLARHQTKGGELGGIECTAVGGLAFLGSGNPKYQENIARIVKLILEHFKPEKEWPYGVKKFGPSGYWPGHGLETWRLNYAAIFLSEYYLATGDSSVLPTMDKLNKNIAFRQLQNAPEDVKKEFAAKKNPLAPYWFSHQFPPDGYGHLGVNVANALLAWELMAECGVAVDRDNFEKTRDYVQVAGPTGEMPYAGAPNQRGGDGDAFGRTGVLAMAYHLCNDRDAFNGKIAAALRRLQRNNYFTSHASSDQGKAWGTLGMAALDPTLFREALDAHKFDYCLVRLSDGSFAANPEVHFQNGGSNNDFGYGRVWTTAFNALLFTLPKQRLRITGSWGLPGVDQNSLSKTARQVADLARNGRYGEATKLAVRMASNSAASESDKRAAAGIQEYTLRQGKRAATQLEKIRAGGDVYLLKMQIAEKKKTCAGIETFDGPVAAMEAALDTEEARAELRVGVEFHRIEDAWRKLTPTQAGQSLEMLVRRLDALANNNKGSVYGQAARKAVEWFQEPGKTGDPFTVYFESGGYASADNSAAPGSPAQAASKTPPAAGPARVAVSPEALGVWQQRFVKKLDALGKAGRKVRLDLGDRKGYVVRGANEQSLIVNTDGNDFPMPWRMLSADCRAALAKDAATDDDVEALLIAAVFHLAIGRSGEAETLFARAALKDAEAVKLAKAELTPR